MFTVEYDVAQHENLLDRSSAGGGGTGPVLVEIRRDVGDIVGFGLNVDHGSGHIFVESIKQASINLTPGSRPYETGSGSVLVRFVGQTTRNSEET